jgi:hypothetical protein
MRRGLDALSPLCVLRRAMHPLVQTMRFFRFPHASVPVCVFFNGHANFLCSNRSFNSADSFSNVSTRVSNAEFFSNSCLPSCAANTVHFQSSANLVDSPSHSISHTQVRLSLSQRIAQLVGAQIGVRILIV